MRMQNMHEAQFSGLRNTVEDGRDDKFSVGSAITGMSRFLGRSIKLERSLV